MTNKKTPTSQFAARAIAVLRSRWFFLVVIAIFLLQAGWIALSGRYPMAFDEDFHVGIIRLYAHHWSPFWGNQAPGGGVFGAVARDPSYLYQYFMSFPYRFVSLFTSDQTILVLVLRFISIALFATALPLYKRVLLKLGVSRAIAQACLALFVLIPIVPLLAAQVNYDNLLIPLTALVLLLTIRFNEELTTTKRLNSGLLLLLLSLGMLTSLVKYAFLPVFAVVIVYLGIRLKRIYGGRSGPGFLISLGFGFTLMTRRVRAGLVALFLLSLVLFGQRYGVNLVRYHTPIPDCGAVLSVRQCSAYGPWSRDYNLTANKSSTVTGSPLVFSADWFYGMWLRTFFAVDGPGTDFQTRGPLIIPSIGAIVFTSVGAATTVAYLPRLLRKYNRPVFWLFVATIGVYVVTLWLNEYQSFLSTGQSVAINGRYLLPILPLFMVLCILGLRELLRKRESLKIGIFVLACVCMLWGGGALTYILRSNRAWYWPNTTVYDANHAVQQTLGPVTPGYRRPNEFMGGN